MTREHRWDCLLACVMLVCKNLHSFTNCSKLYFGFNLRARIRFGCMCVCVSCCIGLCMCLVAALIITVLRRIIIKYGGLSCWNSLDHILNLSIGSVTL